MARLHYEVPSNGPMNKALCGWTAVQVAESASGVTCKRCRRALEAVAAAQPAPEAPFVPSGPYEVPRATSALSERGRRAIERSLRGEAPERVWSSAKAALRAWLASGRPSPTRSTSDPSRFEAVQVPSGTSYVERMYGRIDRMRNISLAWDRARDQLMLDPESLARLCPWMVEGPDAPARAIAAAVERAEHLAMEGVRGHSTAGQLAGDEARRTGERVTAHQVGMVIRHFTGAVRAALIASGEMEAPAGAQEQSMAVRGYDLGGWDEIEEYARMSRGVMRRLSEREDDPFPIHEVEGVRGYQAKKADIDAWLERNAGQRKAGAL